MRQRPPRRRLRRRKRTRWMLMGYRDQLRVGRTMVDSESICMSGILLEKDRGGHSSGKEFKSLVHMFGVDSKSRAVKVGLPQDRGARKQRGQATACIQPAWRNIEEIQRKLLSPTFCGEISNLCYFICTCLSKPLECIPSGLFTFPLHDVIFSFRREWP
jgi:hypothetical protein